ncbi:MAG TPA: 50S ribosomal protein L1 [Bacteroidota bacterium]|jgi:large subunit ribosomal protein L1|nr:50S ribosomal protein L1 [Bacteroidota bacterium]
MHQSKKYSKRFKAAIAKTDQKKMYSIEEAVDVVKSTASAKFTEAVDIAVRLGVDPKKADQAVRGTVALPHGIGKAVRVLVIAKPPKDEEAKAAGADHAGYTEYIQKIQGGWADIDVIIATPDVMGELGKLGKVLGPRGLMPNPKSGTVTPDVAKAVKEVKAGKIEFRVDKAGILHATVGKANFDKEKLVDNINAFLATVARVKPATAKGQYVRSIALSCTMGPGVHIDRNVVGVH